MIRPAERRDIPEVFAVETACYSTPWREDAFHTLLLRDYVLFRVLEVAADQASPAGGSEALPPAAAPPEPISGGPAEDSTGKVVGFGVLWWGGGEAELANLAIHPQWQGGGRGGDLLDALLAEAGIRGVTRVFLEVRESNAPARALYQSRGFIPVGRRRRYYQKPTEDALVLSLELNPAADE